MNKKFCENCGQVIKNPRAKKWCDACRFVTFPCALCGKVVTVKRSQYDQSHPTTGEKIVRHFCSRKCAIGFGSQIAAKQRENKVNVTCPNCSKVNERKASHAYRLFCDVRCYGEYRRKHSELYPPNRPGKEAMKRLRGRKGAKNPNYGNTGDKSPHWKGGSEKRRCKGWGTIRKLIQRRDENRCMLCGKTAAQVIQMHTHHIYRWVDIHCNHPHNLITVCISCHQGRIHGNGSSPPAHQLVTLAQQSTLARLAPDDLQLIVKLDRQHRGGKGLPRYIVDALGLPDSYLDDWQQLPLALSDQSASLSHQAD